MASDSYPPEFPEVYGATFERGDAAEVSSKVLEVMRHKYPHIVSHGGQLYGYRGGVYSKIAAATVERHVLSYAGSAVEAGKDKTRPLRIDSTRSIVIAVHSRVAHEGFFDGAPRGVAFADSFVRIIAAGLASEPLTHEHRARFRYPFALAGEDEPAAFLRFLGELTLPDADAVEKVAALQEFLGAAICGIATQYQRALVTQGAANNGKSKLREVVEAVMPPGSVSALPPALMSDQYTRSLLDGSLLNSVDDLPQDPIDGAFKAIVIGAPTQARDPGGKCFSFAPRCAQAYSWNAFPRIKDTTEGFFRRWLLITLNRQFLEGDPARDPHVLDRILPHEIPAIVRWALKGAERLAVQKEYTLPPSHRVALMRWRGQEDPVPLFLEQCTGADTAGTPARELYQAFKVWGRPYGVSLSETAFGRRLNELNIGGSRRGTANVYYLRVIQKAA